MRAKKMAWFVVASGVAICPPNQELNAAEYAFTAYPLGSLSFGAGITPPAGTYVTDAISFYTGTIAGQFDFGGRTFNAGVKADLFFDGVNILYVPNAKILDGEIGLSVTAPAGYVNYDASVLGPRGNIVTAQTNGTGYGDMVLRVQLGWTSGDFSQTVHLMYVAPTGRYQTGFYPIAGLFRPSVDLGWAFTWFDKDTKLQFNAALGFMASVENYATQYQTGDEAHLEWAIGYKFDNGLEIGIVGYEYRQLTGDSGPGALLGPFEGSVDAIGGGSTYSTKIGETPVTISVRDYEEYYRQHRFEGNLSIASFTAVFPAAQSLKDTDTSPK